MIRIVTLVAVLLTSACATEGKLQKRLNSAVGQNIDWVVAGWGYPQGQFRAPNGNTVYVYSQSGTLQMPATATSNVYGNTVQTTVHGGGQLAYGCSIYLEADANNVIQSFKYAGNTCQSN